MFTVKFLESIEGLKKKAMITFILSIIPGDNHYSF